jgi:hypothetical protein
MNPPAAAIDEGEVAPDENRMSVGEARPDEKAVVKRHVPESPSVVKAAAPVR